MSTVRKYSYAMVIKIKVVIKKILNFTWIKWYYPIPW